MGINIQELGFSIFDASSSKEPKDILIEYIIENGTYYADDFWYKIRDVYSESEYTVSLNIVYNADYGNVFVSMYFYTEEYFVYLYLSFEESIDGVYYGAEYGIFENGNSKTLNETWGYLNPATFTLTTVLTYKEYEGLENLQTDIMSIYTTAVHDILIWLDAYLDDNNLGIDIADLGYTVFK